ncbi:MAG: hypothetical protein E7599_04710 [Ruminococcaceae bacterium]|nr:hypothetical protein [Oscillospiraceae bacterium]
MKILKKLFLPCIILGAAAAELTLYTLLGQCFSFGIALALTALPLVPFLFYGFARISPPGTRRRICNLIGAALLSADCYFMIVTACLGVLLLCGLPLRYANVLLLTDLSVCGVSIAIGMLSARRIRTVHYRVKLPNVKNCKIVFFSDLHLGDFCTDRHLRKVVDAIRAEKPDLVLYGGDLIDMDMPKAAKAARCAAILSEIGPMLACEGNHDLNDPDAAGRKDFLSKAGIRMLYDESIVDEATSLHITARKSIKQKRQSAKALYRKESQILLDHDPKGASEALAAGFPLVLCGHTHKGQTFPGNLIRRFFTPYFYGKYEENGKTVITTGGCGSTGLPLRLFVTNEIVAISLFSDN